MASGGLTVGIGVVAKRSGVSVRMLRHYDEIGLLRPARRSASGYRLYAPDDLARLQAIVALRQLGFGLPEVGELLDGGRLTPAEALNLRLVRLDEEIARREALRDTLRGLLGRLDGQNQPSLDDLLDAMKEMTALERIESYYTEEQLAELARKREALGDEGMQRAQDDWTRLIEEVKTLITDGVPPTDPRARAAADRWMGLVEAFTGGDPGIAQNLQRVWDNEEEIAGVNTREMREMGEYIAKARSSSA
jgi:DNA-binding transcriptional MerR regulator